MVIVDLGCSVGPFRALYIIGGQAAEFSIGRKDFSFCYGLSRFHCFETLCLGLSHCFAAAEGFDNRALHYVWS